MSYDSSQDWQMQSPAWREQQIFNCLCTLKSNLASYFEGGSQPLIYRALLSQGASSAPTDIVLENTFGETLGLNYLNPGNYTITSNNLFTTGKTFVMQNGVVNNSLDMMVVEKANDTTITINTYHGGSLSDDILNNTEITILVYP